MVHDRSVDENGDAEMSPQMGHDDGWVLSVANNDWWFMVVKNSGEKDDPSRLIMDHQSEPSPIVVVENHGAQWTPTEFHQHQWAFQKPSPLGTLMDCWANSGQEVPLVTVAELGERARPGLGERACARSLWQDLWLPLAINNYVLMMGSQWLIGVINGS